MGTPDSRELDRLKERNFGDYSEGHRHMYLAAIKEIHDATDGAGHMPHRRVSIFEAGFGIGYGIKQMLAAGIVGRYVGLEPQPDSFAYTRGELANHPQAADLALYQAAFPAPLCDQFGEFEHVFCIEVIEHVPMDAHEYFLSRLWATVERGGVLWFSTPCIRRAPHEGVRTTEEWAALVQRVTGVAPVVDRSRWTYLYRVAKP
jgi:hypothetical protein